MMILFSTLVIIAPIANDYIYHFPKVYDICKIILISEAVVLMLSLTIVIAVNKGVRNLMSRQTILRNIEKNLISVGAYIEKYERYAVLPRIKVKKYIITIRLPDLRIRTIIERYLDLFSTALPERYIVEDYYISQNNAEVIIVYEDMKNYKPERYVLSDYVSKIKSMDLLSLYFDRKHTVSLRDYPHFLISGSSGSGKSYLANQIVIQAIIKGYEVIILDLKRSYGLYRDFANYAYELDDIIDKLRSVESQMFQRMKLLQSELDKNPNVIAVDAGCKPMLVVIEEYISLTSSLDKKQKEEVERIVKNLSVLARQSNIHIMIVMQSAGTENINATTRSNLTKILLGNAQSNIITSTFGTGVSIPNMKMEKGTGLIQLDRISVLRVPRVDHIEQFIDQKF